MSIVFTQPVQEKKLRMAFNNDILRFRSDSLPPVSHCVVLLFGLTVRLYPDPSNNFFVNLKPYASSLLNANYFDDTLIVNPVNASPQSFIYNYTNNAYKQTAVKFEVFFTDATSEQSTYTLRWLAGVQQIANYINLTNDNYFLLSPFRDNEINHHYIKYWKGYPFDISIFCTGSLVKFWNNTNLLSQAFDLPGTVSRLLLSDGRADETVLNVLPLVDGYNKLRMSYGSAKAPTDCFITVEKVPYKCGVYFKWLNCLGGYSYWLFEDVSAVDRSFKQLGEIDRDYNNVDASLTRTIQIGKESQDTIKVITEQLNDDERAIVEGIIDSPKVYMFTGEPFSKNQNWIEVSLKTTSSRIKNYKERLTNIALDFELPQRYTQTL